MGRKPWGSATPPATGSRCRLAWHSRATLSRRSSAVDEDGAAASFAGQHLTLLNVHSPADVPGAIREVWWSANSDSAITYRQQVGLFTRPSVGVVVQRLLNPAVADLGSLARIRLRVDTQDTESTLRRADHVQ